MKLQSVLFLLVCLSLSPFAYAAPPDAGSILREQQTPSRMPDQLPKPDETAKERPLITDNTIKVMVKGFRFIGIRDMANETELQELLKDAIGTEEGLADLQQLAGRITTYLRQKGFFLARAYLPKQDITEGIVEIAVIGGRVDDGASIRTKEGGRIRSSVLQGMVDSGARKGEPLEEGPLERSLLLMNDLPGVTAKGTLERGKSYGSTRVLIDADEGPLFSGGFSADNFGNHYTGDWRGTGFANLNDPFGIGDQFSLALMGEENLYKGKAVYSSQLLPNGLKGSISYDHLYYKLGEELESLNAHGYADALNIGLGYPLIRSRVFSLWANTSYEYRLMTDYAGGVQTKDRTINAGMAGLYSSIYDRLGGGGLNDIGLTVIAGDLNLENNDDAQVDAATARTAGNYTKFNYSVARLQHLTGDFSLFGSANGQFAGGNLDSSEKFILGGPTGVRSYPVGEASGDEGHSFTTELRYDTPLPATYGKLQLIGFFDTGTITVYKDLWENAVTTATGKNSYWLSGSGIGLNYSKPGVFALRATWAQTLGDNDGRSITGKDVDNSSSDNRFWLQLTFWF